MKQIICFLAAVVLIFGASACADRHLDIQCTAAGSPETAITFDLYEQEGSVYTLSSLFPDYVYRTDQLECFNVSDIIDIISMRAGLAQITDEALGYLFSQWIEKRLSKPVNDEWAGELFENTSSSRTAEFWANELIGLNELKPSSADQTDSDNTGFQFIRFLADKILNAYIDSDLKVFFRSFEEGKYISASVSLQENIIMTISADCSDISGKHLLISYRENGRYYFRDIMYRYDADNFTITSTLRSSDTSSSAGTETGMLLFSEAFSMNNEPDRSAAFQFTFDSPSLEQPLIITGSEIADESANDILNASVCIGDPSTEVIRVCVSSEKLIRPVAFTDKEIVGSENKNGNDKISLSTTTRLMLFAAEMIPALPQSYQNIIWYLLAL